MPSRERLEKRLRIEEERLCSVCNILGVIIELLNTRDEDDDHMLWGTLRVANDMVGEVLSGISASYLLKADRRDD